MDKITLLGKSDATLSMIIEILVYNNIFPTLDIVNNLNLKIDHIFENDNIKYNIINELKSKLELPE